MRRDNYLSTLWIEKKNRAAEMGDFVPGDVIVVTSPFKMREINTQYDGELMHKFTSYMI